MGWLARDSLRKGLGECFCEGPNAEHKRIYINFLVAWPTKVINASSNVKRYIFVVLSMNLGTKNTLYKEVG